MTTQIQPYFLSGFQRFARMAGVLVILVSGLVLAGWQFDIEALRSIIPGLTAMNPGGTALAFLFTGAALCIQAAPAVGPRLKILSHACVWGILLITLTRFAGYRLNWDGGIDQFLFRAKLDREALLVGHPNRMAPNTAGAFLLVGLALQFLDVKIRRVWPAQFLALAVALIALLTIIGYAYSSLSLTGVKEYIPMALNTAMDFALVSAALLCVRPRRGLMKVVSDSGAGGALARRLLPVVIMVPAVVGWVGWLGQREGILDQVMVLSLFALTNIIIFTALVWWNAATLADAEKKLRDSELRYKLAVRGSNDGLWDWNIHTNSLYWSERFKEMLEINGDDFSPHYDEFKKRLHPEDHDRIVAELEKHTRIHEPYDAEFRMRADSGKYIWVRARGASVWGEDGRTTRMSGAVTDITAGKEIEQELKAAREQADRASQTKSEFLANMSHELRTPLNSIIGLTRMLFEDRNIGEEQRDMAGVANRSAENLLDIVNDILDLSKVEAGKLVLENITFSLQEVVDNIMETILPLSSEKGLIFTCNLSTENLPYFVGDPVRLGRILMNLVSNAVKYTEEGSVTVDITCREEGAEKAVIEFSVTDTGIGIPKDKQHLIFDKFVQADSSITRRYGGTGLGLAITRQIVEKMGGALGLESEAGKGSRFWVRIPFAIAETRPVIDKGAFRREQIVRLPPEQRKNAAAMNVLLAEDHLLNQAFMRKLMPRLGFTRYDIVENGEAVLTALAKKPYDMILMDCHMPVMSGYDATKEIRRREQGAGGHIPVIAMTADAMMGTRERCLKAGMDDYISKPLNQDELRYIMGRWVTFPQETADENEIQEAAIDLGGIRKFADNEEELREFVDIFLTQSAEILKILREQCRDGENQAWTDAAHKFKGGAAMIGAEKMRALCERAQEMKSASASDRAKILGEIEAEYNRVKNGLAEVSRPPAGR